MIRINTPEPDDSDWIAWREAGARMRDAMVYTPGGDKPKISDHYKKQKQRLLEIFNNKCAYCETPIEPGEPGDVEHFRPKGAVLEDDGTPVTCTEANGHEYDHPGYYWLAYEWTNLLPSCRNCNTRGKESGKGNFFPLVPPPNGGKPFRATAPSEEADEVAALVHPWREDPNEHFAFDKDGHVLAASDRGKASVDLLGLNREQLVTNREQTYSTAKDKFNLYMGKASTDTVSLQRLQEELRAWREGRWPYSAVARVALAEEKEELKKRMDAAGL